MSKAVNTKWKKTFPDTIGNQNRPATGVDDTQPFETGAFPQYMANDPVRYDLQNAAMSQSMSNDARLKEMVDARGKELDDHKVDPGAHKTGIAGNAATATKVVTNAAAGKSANIAEASMAGDDSARIRVSGAYNAGELALETADDGNEAIVARQYTGDFKDVARTAAILDANGNTSFPGTVVAPKFTGTFSGNAASATKLQTPRTLSLSGKATGSASFDGSANAAINVTSVNADTASKLSTARKINLTGNASGSANFDGSSDISINVNVNQADTANNVGNLKSKTYHSTDNGGRRKYLILYDITNWYNGNDKNNLFGYYGFNGIVTVDRYGGFSQGATTVLLSAAVTWKRNDVDINDTYENTKHLRSSSDVIIPCIIKKGDIYYLALQINVSSYNFNFLGTWQGPLIWQELLCQSGETIPAGYEMVLLRDDHAADAKVVAASTADTCTGNAATATKLQTSRTISLSGNASGSANFDGSGNISINATVSQAANADTVDGIHAAKLFYDKGAWDADNWATTGAYEVKTNRPTSAGYNYGHVISSSSGGSRFQLYVAHLYNWDGRLHYRTGWGDDKQPWNTILDSENYNNFAPTKTGSGASGTWPISISGTATNADTVDGYHASELISKIQDITPKTAAAAGQFRELVVNDSHQVKLPDGGTWAYFVYTYNSWSGDDSNGEHRTRTGAGIAAGGTVLHTDGSITSNTINAFHLSGTTGAGGADGNTIIVGGFCWRIA